MRILSTNKIKPRGFDFSSPDFDIFRQPKPKSAPGWIQTSELRDIAENKRRLAASAAKKAALAAKAKAKAPRRRGAKKAK